MIQFDPKNRVSQIDISSEKECAHSAIDAITANLGLLKEVADTANNFLRENNVNMGTLTLSPESLAMVMACSGSEGDIMNALEENGVLCYTFTNEDDSACLAVKVTQEELEEGYDVFYEMLLEKQVDDDMYVYNFNTHEWILEERNFFRETHPAMEPVFAAYGCQPTKEEEEQILKNNAALLKFYEIPIIMRLMEFDIDISNDPNETGLKDDITQTQLMLAPKQLSCCGVVVKQDVKSGELLLCQDFLASDLYALFAEVMDEEAAMRHADGVKEGTVVVARSKNPEDFIEPLVKMLDHYMEDMFCMTFPLSKEEFLIIFSNGEGMPFAYSESYSKLSDTARENAKTLAARLHMPTLVPKEGPTTKK